MNPRRLIPRRRTLLIALALIAGLVLVYALGGFFLAPWLAKREVPRIAAEQLGARARVAEVAFNPFTLRLRVTGFALETQGGNPLLAFREATADIGWRSLTRRELVLSQLTLRDPEVRVEISDKGALNLAALGGTRPASEKQARTVPRFAVEAITVENGSVSFDDRRQGYQNRFEQLSLHLSSISTAQGDKGPYELAARMADGGKVSWKGEASITPLALSGTLVLEHGALHRLNPYLTTLSGVRVASGRARLSLSHHFELAGGAIRLGIRDAKLVMHELAMAVPGSEQPFARIGQLELEGAHGELQARRASARALRISDFSVTVRRDAGGVLHPRGLTPAPGDPAARRAPGQPWRFDIGEVTLSGGAASLADEESGIAVMLQRIRAKIADLSSDTAQPVAFEMEAGGAEGSRLAASGKAVPAAGTLQARIEASGLPVAPWQGLIARYADVKVLSGSLTVAGELSVGGATQAERDASVAFTGAASLDNVAVRDGAGTPLVEWKTLATKSLRLSISPHAARMDDLSWTAPKARLEIAADGTTNLTRLFRRAEKPAAPGPAPAPARAESGVAAPAGGKAGEAGDFPVRIRRVQVSQGTLDFTDRSLSPNFSTLIHGLAGTVSGISTERSTRSQIALEGRVDEFGHARLSGALNLFDPDERTTFRMRLRNLDVARVSPYTIKFAGYRVNSGRMSLDLNYRVTDRRVQGDNKILLDNFVLGERVAGTDAPDVPLELAVSLLKDENGRIDIAVPISGSLDDPDFRLGEVVWKAIGNVVRNVVSAPFRALGRLFGGGGEQLAAIAFIPGSSRLLPPEQEKLKRIVEGLVKRPDLKLLVPARYDAEADARALKREGLRREVGKRAGFEIGSEQATAPIDITDRRTRSALRGMFAERIGKDELERLKDEAERTAAVGAGKQPEISILDRVRNFASGEPQVANPSAFYRELSRRLLESQALPDDALDDLARKRAAAIGSELEAAGADPARFELSKSEPTANAGAKEVTVQLSLAAAH